MATTFSIQNLVGMATMIIFFFRGPSYALNKIVSPIVLFHDNNERISNYVEAREMNSRKDEQFPFRNSLQYKSKFLDFYLPYPGANISAECANDVFTIKTALNQTDTLFTENRWALKLYDSWGKFENGILEGNINFLGFFDECLAVRINRSRANLGRYCLISYGVNISVGESVTHLIAQDGAVASDYATCIPSTCLKEDIEISVRETMKKHGFKLEKVECQSTVDHIPLDGGEILGIVVFSFFGFILVLGSSLDILFARLEKNSTKKGISLSCLLAFSVPKNLSKIFRISTKESKNVITCMHGLRFLSITWVVMVHQYSYSQYTSSNKFSGPEELSKNILFQIPLLGDTAVDTFFVMSGLLVSYNFFKSMAVSRSFSFVQYCFHRFIRLAPPIATCVLFCATLASLAVSGPFAIRYKDVNTEACRRFWWIDWTFFSNFVFRFGSHLLKNGKSFSCLSQCWYVSVDTQLYLVMPAILLPMLYFKRGGLSWLTFWTVASFLVPTLIIAIHHTYPSAVVSTNEEKTLQYTHLVYLMPYTRAAPYLIGIWTGYILWIYGNVGIHLNKWQVVLGWTLSFTVGLFVVFGLYPYNEFSPSNLIDDINFAYSVFYGGLRRGLWGFGIAWLITACHFGYGGVVNKFLSYPAFQPLGRLTFCIYLVSLPLQYVLFYSTIRPTYYNNITKITEICGVVFLSGICAVALSLISEIPVSNLEKALKHKVIS